MDPSSFPSDPAPQPVTSPAPEAMDPAKPVRFWLHLEGKTYGPYPHEELRQFVREGRASPEDMVCPESSQDWISFRDLEAGIGNGDTPPRFHHVSPGMFVFLSFATVGVYPLWWFWMCWREVAKRHPAEGIMPFWRGYFCIFWFHALCRRIEQESGLARSAFASQATLAFILLTVTWKLPDPWCLFQLFNFLPALYPVLLVDRLNQKLGTRSARSARLRWWQIPLVIGGLLACCQLVLSGVGVFPNSRVVTGSELSRWHRSWLVRHEMLGADEQPLFFYSAGMLWLDTEGNLMTNRGLVSYYQDPETRELVTFRAAFEDIHRIEVMDAENWLDHTTLKVWTRDNTEEDEWFSLIFSTESDVDNKVLETLRRWVDPERVRLVAPEVEETRGKSRH